MTAHNHGYDPTCKETRLPDGRMVGECMADTTNTPTPEMDAFERDIIARIPEDLHQLQAYARKGRELETRLAAAEAELAALRSAPAPAAAVDALTVMRDNARTATEKNMAEQAISRRDMECPICQKEMGTADCGPFCNSCKEKHKDNGATHGTFTPYQTGWVCPRCGSVYGPSVTECCRCSPPMKFEVTF